MIYLSFRKGESKNSTRVLYISLSLSRFFSFLGACLSQFYIYSPGVDKPEALEVSPFPRDLFLFAYYMNSSCTTNFCMVVRVRDPAGRSNCCQSINQQQSESEEQWHMSMSTEAARIHTIATRCLF